MLNTWKEPTFDDKSSKKRLYPKWINRNPRSMADTLTEIYKALRMVYEKLGAWVCPNFNQMIASYECKKEIEKSYLDFKVFMYCNSCNYRMEN